MEIKESYCPLSGKCTHEPINIEPNSYFLIEPFDYEKDKREKAIKKALDLFYKDVGVAYNLKISESKDLHKRGLYCDICFNIKSSQFCIVDITGDLYYIKNNEGKIEDKIFLRPNIALELGLAYGFNKPTFILSGRINGKREIPSDLKFIRYLNNEIQFDGWETLSINFLDVLRQSMPHLDIETFNIDSANKDTIKRNLRYILHLKQKLPIIKVKNYRVNQIIWDDNRIVGIINGGGDLFEGAHFKIYILEDSIEKVAGGLKVDYVRPDGIAQVLFYYTDNCREQYLKKVFMHCSKNKNYVPKDHRLELMITEDLEIIEKLQLEQLEILLKTL